MTAFLSVALGLLAGLPSNRVAGESVPASDGLSFLAVGDWGGNNDAEPSTEGQRMAGESMARTFRDLGASFTLMMGDNFYTNGIGADSGAWSKRFLETFEQVYATHLPGVPFYAMAGNHDYGEGVLSNLSAQLAYSRQSEQWRYPALWYRVRRTFQAGGHRRTLDVLVTDSVVLCSRPGLEADIDIELQFVGGQCDRTRPGELRARLADEQWAWIERELAGSDADYLWVVGHYPIWSAGKDGSSPCLIERLRPLLLAYGAHYMSGHDHMLEHFAWEGFNSFVVGAGKECCYGITRLGDIPPGIAQYMLAGYKGVETFPPVGFPVLGGYASVQFGAESAEVVFYAHNGATLYTSPPIPRRNRWAMALRFAAVAAVLTSRFAAVAAVLTSATCFLGTALRHRKRGGSSCDEAWRQQAAVKLLSA